MFDYIIKNGQICDGTGGEMFYGDVAVKGDRIVKIGDLEGLEAANIIDAGGKCLTPGFIDPHTHADMTVVFSSEMDCYIRQGVTTIVAGNCGHSSAPLGDEVFFSLLNDLEFLKAAGADPAEMVNLIYDKELAKKALKSRFDVDLDWDSFASFHEKMEHMDLGCNIAPLAGYNAVRTSVMGKDCMRAADEEEMQRLEAAVEKCMEEGAFGLSTGRDPAYVPGPFATEEEMIRMLRIVKEYDGIFTSHTYNTNAEGIPDRMGGYEEMMRQSRGAGVRMHISHVHVSGMAKTGEEAEEAARRTLKQFEQWRSEGVELSFDVIPSAMCSDYELPFFAFFIKPLVLMSGSRKQLAENLALPEFCEMIHRMIQNGSMPYFNEDAPGNWFGKIVVLRHKEKRFVGKTFQKCGELLEQKSLDTMLELFRRDCDMLANLVMPDFAGAVDILCSDDNAMPCSDGMSYGKEVNMSGNDEIPIYPNSMNSSYIPRYLLCYGKENFAKAVYKASGLVAERFHITDRGVIKEGNYADLVILDRTKLRSFDEEENTQQDPEGIDYVFVNGKMVLANGQVTDAGHGKVLRLQHTV